MTGSTRILLCRLGCIAFCFLPTTFIGGWTCWRASGQFSIAQRADWQRELSQRSGLIVEIGAVSYPSPSLARLEYVQLLDPESRQPVAAASAVEIAAQQDGWQVELWRPQIQAGGLAALARAIDERLLRGSTDSLATVSLHAAELTIGGGESAQSLLDLTARFTPQPTRSETACDFRLPEAAQPIRLAISRSRQQLPPATRWQLDTAGQSLPCGWFAAAVPGVPRLGAACRFSGALSLVDSGGAWSGDFAGRLAPLDLDSLVTEQFPHQLSGQATLDIERATIDRGRLTGLLGALRAQHGALSPSLLAAAGEHLQLAVDARFGTATAAPISFQQLAFRFQLDDRTLALSGEADPTQPGVLIAAATGPIASAPPRHAIAAVNLLRALLPAGEFQVPAARQTGSLVNLLPVPDAAGPAAAHTPTRLIPTPAASPARAVRQPMIR